MNTVDLVLCLLTIPMAIWVAVLLLQSLWAVFPARSAVRTLLRPRVAILIPAHNEAAGIALTLQSLAPQLQLGDRILVIADNCTDDTARIAASFGAEVVERHDTQHRGKGYALDLGVRSLAENAPKIVIIIDADCTADARSIDHLVQSCHATERPVQALYLMQSQRVEALPGPLGQLREFAWVVRNLVRPLGNLRMGLPCQLMGTGMAFPWPLIAKASLANSHLVEDMQLGVDLARAGAAPVFCPQAVVRSEFPISTAGAGQQRRRWEHGHLGMIIGTVPGLLFDAVRQRNGGLLALAVDMSVPPLALLVLLLLTLSGLAALSQSFISLTALLGLWALLSTAIFLAWWRHGRQLLKLRTLLLTPFYVLAKLPLYIGFLRRRQTEWVRSSRD